MPDHYSFLLGTAIGDAFGAGVEFQDRDWIRANVDFTTFVNARHTIKSNVPAAVFTENYQPWDYTDDTEMTIGLIKALLSGRPFTEDLLVEYWTAEYADGIRRKGFGRNGHGSMRWVFSGEKSIAEVRDFQRERPNPGNAPVMRAAPLGQLPEHLIDHYAVINADATHPHPAARAASVAVARAASFFLKNIGPQHEVIPYCLEPVKNCDPTVYVHLKDVDQQPEPEKINQQQLALLLGPQPIQEPYFLAGINGLPSDAMLTAGAVLWILKHAKSVFGALKTSVYLGGDVDSAASVCTGILAGKYGLSDIPPFMVENVEGREYLKELSSEMKFLTNNDNHTLPPGR